MVLHNFPFYRELFVCLFVALKQTHDVSLNGLNVLLFKIHLGFAQVLEDGFHDGLLNGAGTASRGLFPQPLINVFNDSVYDVFLGLLLDADPLLFTASVVGPRRLTGSFSLAM
jgi:hypothetical protein